MEREKALSIIDDEGVFDSRIFSISDSYYHKNMPTICPYRPYPPSDLIDFDKFPITESKYPLDTPPAWCINNPNRLTALIREKESDVSYMSEGLIKTAKKELLHKIFKKSLIEHVPEELRNLKISALGTGTNNGDETVFDYAFFNEPEKEITPIARFVFAIYSSGSLEADDKAAGDIAKDIADELYCCGYNFSAIRRIADSKADVNGKKAIGYYIQFEAKFSDFEFEMAPALYHVTLERYIDKIKTRGLVPSSKSSLFRYPERVYLFNFHNEESASYQQKIMISYMRQRLMSIFGHETGEAAIRSKFDPKLDKGFYIVKITRKKLMDSPLFTSGKLDFYIDACYDGQPMGTGKSPAIFTYNNIPANIIERSAMYCPILTASKYKAEFGSITNVTI